MTLKKMLSKHLTKTKRTIKDPDGQNVVQLLAATTLAHVLMARYAVSVQCGKFPHNITKWHQRLNWMGLAWPHQWLHQHRRMYLYFCQLYVVKSQIMSDKSEGPTDRREGGVATKPPLASNGSVLQPNLGSCNEGESSLYRQKNGDKKTEALGAVVERPQESFSRGGWQQQDTSTG